MATVSELFDLITTYLQEYQGTALEGIRRNSHMNDTTGADIDQRDIEALLSEYVCFFMRDVTVAPTIIIDLLKMLTAKAKAFRLNAMESVRENQERNFATGAVIDQRDIDALLTDFINFVGYKMCVDYALYASDLAA